MAFLIVDVYFVRNIGCMILKTIEFNCFLRTEHYLPPIIAAAFQPILVPSSLQIPASNLVLHLLQSAIKLRAAQKQELPPGKFAFLQ